MNVKKKYKIFSGIEIELDLKMISFYEQNVAPFHENTAEYFALTSGCNKSDSKAYLEQSITKAIQDEIALYNDKENIARQAKEAGII